MLDRNSSPRSHTARTGRPPTTRDAVGREPHGHELDQRGADLLGRRPAEGDHPAERVPGRGVHDHGHPRLDRVLVAAGNDLDGQLGVVELDGLHAVSVGSAQVHLGVAERLAALAGVGELVGTHGAHERGGGSVDRLGTVRPGR